MLPEKGVTLQQSQLLFHSFIKIIFVFIENIYSVDHK